MKKVVEEGMGKIYVNKNEKGPLTKQKRYDASPGGG